MKTSQIISKEIMFEKLLEKLMRIMIENAGAQRGILILYKDGSLNVEAEIKVEKEGILHNHSTPLTTYNNIPKNIVYFVERTKKDVLISNDTQFSDDPYIIQHNPKSILCIPILNQGTLVSILYLENKILSGAFTKERVEVLRLLSSQVSISLENAVLYKTLDARVKKRTSTIHERNEQLLDEIKNRENIEKSLKEANKQLKDLANIDGLTQSANRRRFDQFLAENWNSLVRSSKPLSLILCDIDYFKLYNDTYGHQAGDECLIKVADAIKNAVRRSTDLVARYGGEEFAIILPNTKKKDASIVAEAVRKAVSGLNILHEHGNDKSISISVGLSTTIPTQEKKITDLIESSDKALYKAKGKGRNCVVLD